MTHDNSDYEKVRTKLHELLPNVLRSDVNETVFENLMNRFLTKQEIEKVAGYIGVGNPNALVSRQIPEPTVHRQAFQLQPIVYNKVGSIEHMASWYDLLNELERLGVDIERLPIWGSVQQFNWVPPVDIDKIINYQDYYWFNPDTPGSNPEYITIRSRCTTAVANANFWERITDEFGLTIPFFRIAPVDATLPVYPIESINPGTQEVVITGDATEELASGNFFIMEDTVTSDGEHKITTVPVYSPVFDNTTFVVDGTILGSETSVGTVNVRRFDKLIINGEYTRLLETGFIFFIKESLNSELSDSFWMVKDSEYDEALHETTVQLEGYFTDSESVGIISNEEQLNFYLAERDCQCTGSVGWDLLQWDDNPEDPLWGGVPPGDHVTLLASISNIGPPVGSPFADGQLWWDTLADVLYQYSANPLNLGWHPLYNNFSLIVEKTEGMAFWDLTPGCGIQSRIPAADQWIDNNFWFHKSDIPNFSIAKQAQYPIIEYDWDLELNEWTFVDSIWQYRRDQYSGWEDIDAKPSLIELQPLNWWEHDVGEDEIVLDERFGDMTGYFTVGSTFSAVGTGEGYEVERVHYSSDVVGEPFRTRIKLTVTVASTSLLPGDFSSNRPSITQLIPILTSQGDVWRDYGDQWLFVGFADSLPTPHKAGNPFAVVDETVVPTPDPSGDYDYSVNYAVQEYTLNVDAVSVFPLNNQAMSGSLRPLTRRAMVGFNDVRVYVDDVRQYGTYDELDEDVVAVSTVNIIANTWTFASDMTGHVSDGDQIFIDANTTGASGVYTVSAGGVAGAVVTVDEIIPPGTAGNGNMSNVTAPMSGIATPLATYVRGIEFLAAISLVKFQQVRIEVGEASINETGAYRLPVRLDPVNTDFVANGFTYASLITCRKNEQVKSSLNQYPLFDIYNVDGTPANRANPIFGYREDPDYPVVAGIGLRVVRDPVTGEFEFDQFILDEDDGTLYAYRDYSNEINDFWFNPTTNELKFWDEFAWTDKTQMSTYYGKGIVSDIEPEPFYRNIDNFYWYEPTTGVLSQRVVATNSWVEVTNIDEHDYDVTLQTIWKKGLNDEKYVPAKVDWERRTEAEYNEQKFETIEQRAQELILADPNLTEIEAIAIATAEWNASQANPHSPGGAWIGDWEIPDPLYYNNQHENRKHLTIRELLTHFATIIEEQPKIPGYIGPKDSMFHLIPTDEVNYGLGGTIKEFNDGFDTFISSLFVNNVTPTRLIAYAHDQYEALLNNMKESYRRNAVDIFADTSTVAILDLSAVVTNILITSHEQNDNAAFLYGDSTTFIDVDGPNDIGIRNWIITLPYLQVMFKELPRKIVDTVLGLTQIIHHDGHRGEYTLVPAITEGIIQIVNNTDDERTSDGTEAEDTLGRTSNDTPPNTVTEFDLAFITPILGRQGVYWYTVNGPDRVWYRLTVASVGVNEPSSLFADGTLWMDMEPGQEVLRVKTTLPIVNTVVWQVADGLTIGDGRLHNGTDPSDVTTATVSAWQPVDINELLVDTILEVENRLYDAAPEPFLLKYNPLDLQEEDPTTYNEYLEDAFLDYASSNDIASPYLNLEFDLSDPFTWNYKYSTPGAGVEVIEADSDTSTFRVPGDVTTLFDILGFQVTFFIKNSGVNDGTWTTIVSTIANPAAIYNAVDDDTTVYVDSPVVDSQLGIAYLGLLPSSVSTGGESGGDFRDLYEKFYGTPYPHLEPWALQGYTSQPTWWDEEYLNDDVDQWGDRRWKYKHGFGVVGVDAITDTFTIDGDYRDVFNPTFNFNIDQSFGVHEGVYDVDNITAITIANVGLPGIANIEVAGDQTSIFVPGLGIAIANAAGDVLQNVTVGSSFFSLGVTTVILQEGIADVTDWDFVSGATYDVINNQTSILVVQDITNPTIEGRITVALGMWENVRIGVIPPGRAYSNGVVGVTGIPTQDDAIYGLQVPVIPTYNYMSVNIDNIEVSADGGTTLYGPDRLFPPMWDYTGQYSASVVPFDRTVRSIFFNFSTEITAPGADYIFGDSGNVEWEWRQTSQFLYDNLTVAFRMDPVRYVAHTFGIDFEIVNSLQIDARLENTFSHTRTDFHGDIIGNTPYLINGTNQWYVNFNRYGGYDFTWDDFRALWTLWTAPMMYQFSSFIDTPSLSVGHRAIEVSEFDYNVLAKRSPGVDDSWFDAFDVAITHIPPAVVRYDNQGEWRFSVGTNVPVSRGITYHDVHNYQFYADPATDLCTIYMWDVRYADSFNDVFHVLGNQTHVFTSGREFVVENSTANDGNYTVINSVYNAVNGRTLIEVNENFNNSIGDGTIRALYREIPWQTGDIVSLTTAETMPAPFLTDTVNGLYEYFVIRVSETEFRLALTANAATTNQYEVITTKGTGDTFVGQTIGTFTTDRSSTIWRRYVIDESNVLTFSTPEDVTGMQNLIDIVFGYDSYTKSDGWVVNSDMSQRDPNTNAAVNWQVEVERFIDYAYLQRRVRDSVSERFAATVDVGTDVWTFTDPSAQFVTGDKVTILSSNNIYPTPLVRGLTYFMIRYSIDDFALAATSLDATNDNPIDVTSSLGVETLWITPKNTLRDNAPHQEINPFRNNIWFRPERGIVSNVLTGPAEDVRTTQLIFDQYGRQIRFDDLLVMRSDKETRIQYADGVDNDVELTSVFPDPYNYLHLGGMHIFVDSYEHVLSFNNYTSEDQLLYDPFIGLNVTKFEMLFNRQPEFTGRPNVGGYYLETEFNQGADLKLNIEASIDNLRYLYDTYNVLETNQMVAEGRRGLGYEGTKDYLNNLNLNRKSQFVFWRGMIQTKGSVNAIKAFVNSRRFIDAKVDEFWAIKIAEYGSTGEKEYPEMYLNTVDVRTDDVRFQFAREADYCQPGFDTDVFDEGECGFAFPNDGDPVLITDESFTPVVLSDEDRWYKQPDQLETLRNNDEGMYFDMERVGRAEIVNIEDGVNRFPGVSHIEKNVGLKRQRYLQWNAETNDWIEYPYEEASWAWDNLTNIDFVTQTVTTDTPVPDTIYAGSYITIGNTDPDTQGRYLVADVPTAYTILIDINLKEIPPTAALTGNYISQAVFRHNFNADFVEVTNDYANPADRYTLFRLPTDESNELLDQAIATNFVYIPFTKSVEMFRNGEALVPLVDYTETWDGQSYASQRFIIAEDLFSDDIVGVNAGVGSPGGDAYFTLANPVPPEIVAGTMVYVGNDSDPATNGWYMVDNVIGNDIYVDESLTPIPGTAVGNGVCVTDVFDIALRPAKLIEDVHFEQVNSNVIRFLYPELTNPFFPDIFARWTITGYLLNKEAQNPARLMDRESRVVVSSVQYWDPARGFHYQQGMHNVDIQRPTDPALYSHSASIRGAPPVISQPGDMFPNPWNSQEVGTTWFDDSKAHYVPYHDGNKMTDLNARYRAWGNLADFGDIDLYEWVRSDVPPEEYNAIAAQEEGNISIDESVRKSGTARELIYVSDGTYNSQMASIVLGTNQITFDDHVDDTIPWVGSRVALTGFPTTPEFQGAYTVVSYTNTTGLRSNGLPGDVTQMVLEEPLSTDSFVVGQTVVTVWIVRGQGRFVQVDCAVEGAPTAEGYSFDITTLTNRGIVPFVPVDVYSNGRLYKAQDSLVVGSPVLTTYEVIGAKAADQITFQQLPPSDEATLQQLEDDGAILRETPYSVVNTVNQLGQEVPEYYFWVKNKSTISPKGNKTTSIFAAEQGITVIPDTYMFFDKPVPAEDVIIDQTNVTLPNRYVQAILRGMRGYVTADNRYTIRWTRDFTLRDRLGVNRFDQRLLREQSYANVDPGQTVFKLDSPAMRFDITLVRATVNGVPVPVLLGPDANTLILDPDVPLVSGDYVIISLFDRYGDLEKKLLHEEWELFREEQQYHINKWQWDLITESMIGYKLDDPTIRVPNYERELYDSKYGTDTRYGLGEGQAFTDGTLAVSTILSDLLDPDNDFYPVDINVFFERESFDTPEGIISAMETIYNTFPFEHVNRMYFSVLLDALSVKLEYEGLFKTSMIALHGIRPFQVAGVFDD